MGMRGTQSAHHQERGLSGTCGLEHWPLLPPTSARQPAPRLWILCQSKKKEQSPVCFPGAVRGNTKMRKEDREKNLHEKISTFKLLSLRTPILNYPSTLMRRLVQFHCSNALLAPIEPLLACFLLFPQSSIFMPLIPFFSHKWPGFSKHRIWEQKHAYSSLSLRWRSIHSFWYYSLGL